MLGKAQFEGLLMGDRANARGWATRPLSALNRNDLKGERRFKA
jgi:hypothetical protein